MTSLIDIGPLTAQVTVRGHDFEVSGLSVAVIFEIMKDNTAIKKMLMDKQMKAEDIINLVNTTPAIFAQIIAASIGKFGDEDTITFAMNKLVAGEQAMFMEKVLSISFPQGLPQFIDTLRGLFGNSST